MSIEAQEKNLAVFCMDSLGAAYKVLQLVNPQIDVIEVFPLGLQGHVLLASATPLKEFFEKAQADLKDQIVQAHLISKCPERVLRAYLSVENAELEQHVLIAESAYVGDLFALGAAAVGLNLKVMDLRMLRGASSASYMFLTGDVTTLEKLAKSTKIKTTVIQNANPAIRSLFNFQA